MPSSPWLFFSHLGAIDRSGFRSLSLQGTQDFQTGFYTSVEGTPRANYCRKPGFKRPRSWPAAPPEADPSNAEKTRSHNVASVSTRVKDPPRRRMYVNGYYSDWFTIKSGVAQGCPLSPLLFLVVGQALKIALYSEGALKGIKINK